MFITGLYPKLFQLQDLPKLMNANFEQNRILFRLCNYLYPKYDNLSREGYQSSFNNAAKNCR